VLRTVLATEVMATVDSAVALVAHWQCFALVHGFPLFNECLTQQKGIPGFYLFGTLVQQSALEPSPG
jgi:hypothetical protein